MKLHLSRDIIITFYLLDWRHWRCCYLRHMESGREVNALRPEKKYWASKKL